MLRDLKAGAGYVLAGSKLVAKPGLRRFVLIPLLINVLLFAVGIVYAIHLFGTVIQGWLPEWLRWLDWLLWPLFGIIVFGVVFFGFSLVANLIAAPFNGRLAQAVETHLRGESVPAQAGWRTACRRGVPPVRRAL